MKIRWDDVFEELTPAPGGLAKLRARLDEEASRRPRQAARRMRWAAAVATVVLVAAIATAVLWRGGTSSHLELGAAADSPAMVGLGLAPAPTDPVTVPAADRGCVAVERIPVADSDVIYYRVVVLAPPSADADSG